MNYQKGLKSLRNGGDWSTHSTDQSRGMARHRRLVKMALGQKADLDLTAQSRERLREWKQKWDVAEETGRQEQARLKSEQEKKPDINLATARHGDVVKLLGNRIIITLNTSIDPDQPSFSIYCDGVLLAYRDSYDEAYDYAKKGKTEREEERRDTRTQPIDFGNGIIVIPEEKWGGRSVEIAYNVSLNGVIKHWGLATLDEARAKAIGFKKWKGQERLSAQRADGKGKSSAETDDDFASMAAEDRPDIPLKTAASGQVVKTLPGDVTLVVYKTSDDAIPAYDIYIDGMFTRTGSFEDKIARVNYEESLKIAKEFSRRAKNDTVAFLE